jgi:dihydrodipicolinate reductase
MVSNLENDMIKVGIVGGTGYTGVELLRLLAQHPEVLLGRKLVCQLPRCSHLCVAVLI